jgi:hypothetical protein
MNTGCGHFYITLSHEDGHLREIFCNIASSVEEEKASCMACMLEALTRTISSWLRLESDLTEQQKCTEIYNQLIGINCHKTYFSPDKISSCADAIAKGIKIYWIDPLVELGHMDGKLDLKETKEK